MCGITGVIGTAPDLHIKVEKAAHLQDHRGPDFFKTVAGNGYCFCHNRLSVIDLSVRSHQPAEDDNGILVFNGEIYNFKTLGATHLAHPEPSSDTLTLFSLLEQQGPEVIAHLNGMFSFAWYDKTTRTLLLARDRMGIKPLYYTVYDRKFFFASEIKTILALLDTVSGYDRATDINREYIAAVVAFGHAESPEAPFTRVRELPPGTMLTVRCDDLSISQSSYFSVPESIAASPGTFIQREPDRTCVGRFDTLLNESVQLHLISDAPVGILCSGGVDSSLITAMAAKNGANVSIYHATVSDGPGELPYAQMVAQRYGLELTTITMDAPTYIDAMVDTTYHLDAPMYHPSDISLYAISQKAHSRGVKALLCGEGADELFGGYGWHTLFSISWKNYSILRKISRFIDTGYRALKLFRHADYFNRQEFFDYAGAYLPYSNSNIPLFAKRNALLQAGRAPMQLSALQSAYIPLDSFPHLATFITSNLYGHLSTLLQRNDRMCMRASIESRVPFLENRLIDFALHLDSSYKIRGRTGKFIVKKCAEAYLPRPVIYRRKAGFPVPWQEYTRQVPLTLFNNGFMANHFNLPHHEIIRWAAADTELLFTAINLEIWGRLFVAGESRDHVKSLLRK